VMIVNRHGSSAFAVRLALGGVSVQGLTLAIEADVECFELHHADITAANTWENKEKVKPQKSTSGLTDASVVQMAAGSFKLLRFELVSQ
jgi:alpha-L-arabinofuranosidase